MDVDKANRRILAVCPFCDAPGHCITADMVRLNAYRKAVREAEIELTDFGEPVGAPRDLDLSLRSCFHRCSAEFPSRLYDLFWKPMPPELFMFNPQVRCDHLVEMQVRCDIAHMPPPFQRTFTKKRAWQHPELRSAGFECFRPEIASPRRFLIDSQAEISISVRHFCEWVCVGSRRPELRIRSVSGVAVFCESITMLTAMCPELLQRREKPRRRRC